MDRRLLCRLARLRKHRTTIMVVLKEDFCRSWIELIRCFFDSILCQNQIAAL